MADYLYYNIYNPTDDTFLGTVRVEIDLSNRLAPAARARNIARDVVGTSGEITAVISTKEMYNQHKIND